MNPTLRPRLPQLVALLAVAVAGGIAALAGASITGNLGGGTTTVIREGASPSSIPVAATNGALSVNEIYKRASSGVVQITSTSVTPAQPGAFPGGPFQPQPQEQQALGSGFVIDKAGHIVTNYHVVQNAREIEVAFSNQDTVKAKIVGSDPSTDIAVLQVEADTSALTPLQLGDSDQVVVGDSVVAIGNPFGLDRTATAGIVSALQRPITAPNGYTIDHVIQTDAPINSGNSGGPLLNTRGQVIGVNSQISTAAGNTGNIGIGFAVPSNTVKTVAAQLIRNGKVERAYLGIAATPIDPELARGFRLPVDSGLVVERVSKGSAAGAAGLKAGTTNVVLAGQSYTLGGDVIVAAAGTRVASLEELRDVLAKHAPGDTITLDIYRGSKKQSLDVKLGRQPPSPQG